MNEYGYRSPNRRLEETIKWGFPHFDYKGAMCCSMAGFKEHCSFGFWKASLLKDPAGILNTGDRDGMGHIGKIASLKDMPSDKVMLAYVKEAALGRCIEGNKKAQAAFDGFIERIAVGKSRNWKYQRK